MLDDCGKETQIVQILRRTSQQRHDCVREGTNGRNISGPSGDGPEIHRARTGALRTGKPPKHSRWHGHDYFPQSSSPPRWISSTQGDTSAVTRRMDTRARAPSKRDRAVYPAELLHPRNGGRVGDPPSPAYTGRGHKPVLKITAGVCPLGLRADARRTFRHLPLGHQSCREMQVCLLTISISVI